MSNEDEDKDRSQGERISQLEQTVEHLVEENERLRTELDGKLSAGQFDAIYQNRIRSDLEEGADHRDDLAEQVSELASDVSSMKATQGDLSPSEQRVVDLRNALRSRAKGGSRRTEGRASMSYSDVQDALADLGHGTVHAPQAYRAMETVGHGDGFEDTTDEMGERVIRVDLSELPFDRAVNDVSNAERRQSE